MPEREREPPRVGKRLSMLSFPLLRLQMHQTWFSGLLGENGGGAATTFSPFPRNIRLGEHHTKFVLRRFPSTQENKPIFETVTKS